MASVDIPPVDLDLRVVRYFVAVADHGHFGRAAAALHITQPSLSRQIRALEKLLGAPLLHRTPQGSHLTDAGLAFLDHARDLLHEAVRAAAHTRAAARPRALRVGYTTNLVVSAAVRELRRRRPDAEIKTTHLPWNGARAALFDHVVDVAVTRLPIRTDGIDVTVAYHEPRAVLLARHHPLASRGHLDLADLAGEPVARTSDPAWDAFWRIDPRPGGQPAPDGPLLDDPAELFDALTEGHAVAIVPADSRAPDLHPELTTVALRGVAPGTVAVVRRAAESNPLAIAFTAYARELLTAGRPSARQS
ncbi:LysR family transcriptional regulator [uncultured Mycobacterium sp.]|uniref:LysR family transcriptional regulator n=1 Tax=uncultured Mycobacterium sp. TaxID=171292 RepID=UPI0035CA5B9C